MKIILVAEDNEADVMLVKEAFKKVNSSVTIYSVKNGVEAVDFLTKSNGFENVPAPHLVLLDINMPKKNGLEALEEIKASEALKHIPVIMFSSSDMQEDINAAYAKNANCYMMKPFTLDEYINVIDVIDKFWLKTTRLPSG